MSDDPTDTTLLHQLKAGDNPTAAQKIWERYFNRLARLAKRKLFGQQRRAADEEDVALSALDSFFRGVENGRFSKLDDRDDLWQVLVMLAQRKHVDRVRRETAQKRGGGDVRGESVFLRPDASHGGIGEVQGTQPTPEFASAFAEECQRMFDLLDDDELRQVVLLKAEGYTTAEIAERLGCVTRSVERKLHKIRQKWSQSVDPDRKLNEP